jgi:hypothetical protein
MSRFVQPETATLTLENGDRLIVKKQLTCGESREASRRYLKLIDGALRVDPLEVGPATVLAYLVDWTLTDDDGAPVSLRGLSLDDRQAVIDTLDMESFAEIRRAIETHEAAVLAAQAEKKTTLTLAHASAPISMSVS